MRNFVEVILSKHIVSNCSSSLHLCRNLIYTENEEEFRLFSLLPTIPNYIKCGFLYKAVFLLRRKKYFRRKSGKYFIKAFMRNAVRDKHLNIMLNSLKRIFNRNNT